MSLIEKAITGYRRLSKDIAFDCRRSVSQCVHEVRHSTKTIDLSVFRNELKKKRKDDRSASPFTQRVVNLSELPEPSRQIPDLPKYKEIANNIKPLLIKKCTPHTHIDLT